MSTPPSERPSTPLRTLAGLVPAGVAALTCVVAFVSAGPSDALRAIQEAGIALWLVVPCAMIAAIAGGVLVALAPGARVPLAIPIALGTWPWIAGLAAASWGASRVEEALTFVDPAQRATLIAAGLSEALLGRVIGGVVGAGVLAGIALALALASLAPRAPNRSAIGAIGGLVAGGLPVLVGIAYVVLGAGVGGGFLMAGIAMLGAIACAIAGYGAGADAPHARAASLAAATPAAALLALACAGGAASQLPIIEVFGALANADPAARVELLALVGDEIAMPVALASYGWGIGLLGCAVLTGWAASRARPTGGRIAGAAAVLFVLIATLLIGTLSERATYAMLEIEHTTPWDALAGFEPVVADGRSSEPPALVVGVDRVLGPGGASAPTAGIESPGPQRDRVAELVAAGMAFDDPIDEAAGRELSLAIDGRVTGATIRALLTIATEAGADRVSLVGVSARVDPATLARMPPMLRGIGGAVDLRAVRALLAGAASGGAASDPRLLHARIVPAHESSSVTLEPRPGGVGETIPATRPGWADEPPPDATRIYLTIDPATPASTVVSVIARARALGHVVVLLADDEIPGGPSLPAAGVADGDGLGFGGGLGGGEIAVGSPEVAGSLPPEAIRRVVARHREEIRFCYEQALARDPALAGTVTTQWTIAADGSVRTPGIASSTIEDRAVGDCITRAIGGWTFPAPEGGGVVRVTYPFVLSR